MKTCTKCNTVKDDSDFRWSNKSKGHRQSWCKSCMSNHERYVWESSAVRRKSNRDAGDIRRRRNRQFLWDYLKTHPCECSESDPVVLEFDHDERSSKRLNVSDLSVASYSLNTLKQEIAKCTVRCANCHRRRTAAQLNWHSDLVTS